jgi:hypothetical protein
MSSLWVKKRSFWPLKAILDYIHAHMRLPFCVIDKKLTFATPRVLISLSTGSLSWVGHSDSFAILRARSRIHARAVSRQEILAVRWEGTFSRIISQQGAGIPGSRNAPSRKNTLGTLHPAARSIAAVQQSWFSV